jgi:hypothetical protein
MSETTSFSLANPYVQTPPNPFHSSKRLNPQTRKRREKTMATNRRVLSISAKRNLTLMPQFLLIQRLFCDKPLNPNPLVAKLLHVPSSRIKTSLDSEQTSALKSFGFSWEALVTSLRSSSPQKAHLVYFFLSFYFTIFFFIFSTLHCLVTEKV